MPRSGQTMTSIAAAMLGILVLVLAILAGLVVAKRIVEKKGTGKPPAQNNQEDTAEPEEQTEPQPDEESPIDSIKRDFERIAEKTRAKQKKQIPPGKLVNGKVSLPIDQSSEEQYKAVVMQELRKLGYVSMARMPDFFDAGIMRIQVRHKNGSSSTVFTRAEWTTWDDRRDFELKYMSLDGQILYGTKEDSEDPFTKAFMDHAGNLPDE